MLFLRNKKTKNKKKKKKNDFYAHIIKTRAEDKRGLSDDNSGIIILFFHSNIEVVTFY